MSKREKRKHNTERKKEEVEMELKIIILGKSEVGKTCLLLKYFDTNFFENSITTIGIDYKTKYFKFDDKKVKINYLDTAGQERFKTITTNYLRNADGILLVYAVDSRESFKLLDEWLKEKGWLIRLFEKHPNYNGKFQIAFDYDFDRNIDMDAVSDFRSYLMGSKVTNIFKKEVKIGAFTYEELYNMIKRTQNMIDVFDANSKIYTVNGHNYAYYRIFRKKCQNVSE